MATFRKINVAKADACVSCPACSCEIPVLNATSLPREFSVPCPNCRGRKSYRSVQIHDRKDSAEATRISEQIHFGTRPATDYDLTVANSTQSMQPKSRLSGFTSWLLQ